jgi:hypothetical protein
MIVRFWATPATTKTTALFWFHSVGLHRHRICHLGPFRLVFQCSQGYFCVTMLLYVKILRCLWGFSGAPIMITVLVFLSFHLKWLKCRVVHYLVDSGWYSSSPSVISGNDCSVDQTFLVFVGVFGYLGHDSKIIFPLIPSEMAAPSYNRPFVPFGR